MYEKSSKKSNELAGVVEELKGVLEFPVGFKNFIYNLAHNQCCLIS